MTRDAQVNAFFTIYEDVEGGNTKLAGTRNSVSIYQQRVNKLGASKEGSFPNPDKNVMAFNAA